jgi:hypothetical protein
MPGIRPRPLRSTTLLSGSSSFSQQPAVELSLRRSLTGHWSLIDPISHKPRYFVCAARELNGYSLRQIHRGDSEGPIIGTILLKSAPSLCQFAFSNGKPNIELKANFRGRHRFVAGGRRLYWKLDVVCRESRTRRIYADTDEDTLLIYEGAETFFDELVASYLTMKCKREYDRANSCSCF